MTEGKGHQIGILDNLLGYCQHQQHIQLKKERLYENKLQIFLSVLRKLNLLKIQKSLFILF